MPTLPFGGANQFGYGIPIGLVMHLRVVRFGSTFVRAGQGMHGDAGRADD